jgi:hypothetical protein
MLGSSELYVRQIPRRSSAAKLHTGEHQRQLTPRDCKRPPDSFSFGDKASASKSNGREQSNSLIIVVKKLRRVVDEKRRSANKRGRLPPEPSGLGREQYHHVLLGWLATEGRQRRRGRRDERALRLPSSSFFPPVLTGLGSTPRR